MSEVSKALFVESKYLGSKIGKAIKFLAETSCMNPEQRRAIANSEVVLLWVKFRKEHPDAELADLLKEFVIPAQGLIGFAEWQRDVLTDLSLRSATIERKYLDLAKELAKEKGETRE